MFSAKYASEHIYTWQLTINHPEAPNVGREEKDSNSPTVQLLEKPLIIHILPYQ